MTLFFMFHQARSDNKFKLKSKLKIQELQQKNTEIQLSNFSPNPSNNQKAHFIFQWKLKLITFQGKFNQIHNSLSSDFNWLFLFVSQISCISKKFLGNWETGSWCFICGLDKMKFAWVCDCAWELLKFLYFSKNIEFSIFFEKHWVFYIFRKNIEFSIFFEKHWVFYIFSKKHWVSYIFRKNIEFSIFFEIHWISTKPPTSKFSRSTNELIDFLKIILSSSQINFYDYSLLQFISIFKKNLFAFHGQQQQHWRILLTLINTHMDIFLKIYWMNSF